MAWSDDMKVDSRKGFLNKTTGAGNPIFTERGKEP